MFRWLWDRAEIARRARTEQWWVVFTDNAEIGWWRVFTCRRFRHCFAFRSTGDRLLIFVDPCRDRTFTVALKGRPWPFVKALLERGDCVIVVNRIFPPYSRRPKRIARRGPVATCAAIIGHELGLDRWVVTPKQLHRILLRDFGGKELTL